MEIRIKVPEGLASQAESRGLPIEAYIEQILTREAGVTSVNGKLQTEQEIREWLASLAQFSERIPSLPENITREWIYQDHD